MCSFRLHACREDGALEAQTVELTWDTITQWESDDEGMSFCFQYTRNDKPKWVKVFSPYVSTALKYATENMYRNTVFNLDSR